MKKTSVLVAGALAASSIVAFSAGPAGARSAQLDYNCGLTTMSVVNDTDLPAEVPVGSTTPMHLTSAATVPSTVLGIIGGLFPTATGVVGDVSAAGTMVGPAPVGTVTTTTDLPIPQTSLSQLDGAGNLVLHLTSASEDFTPPVPGLYTFKAGDFTSTLSAVDSMGAVLGALPPLTCVGPADVDTTIDTVKAVVPSTTTLALARSTEGYGQATTATAKVSSSNPLAATLGTPTGAVRFTVGGRSVSAPLDSTGVARTKLPAVAAGKTYSVVAHYVPAASSFYQTTQSPAKSLRVVKAGTRTAVAAPSIRRGHAEVATIRVTSTYKATVGGKVRTILKKGTKALKSKTVGLKGGTVKVSFGKVTRKGSYTVVAQYLGSANFQKSSGKDGFSVR